MESDITEVRAYSSTHIIVLSEIFIYIMTFSMVDWDT